MPCVVLTQDLADRFSGGETKLFVDAANFRALLRLLNEQFPGLGTEIDRSQGVAIDGEFYQDPHAQLLSENAEVFILPKIAGG
ncbi:MAG: hypothetical protein WA888_19105 [Burkholderiaceae bacterium]